MFAKKTIARKFAAKASLEAWSTASYAVFCEESESEVKNGPKLLYKSAIFEKTNFLENKKLIFLKNQNFQKKTKIVGAIVFFANTGLLAEFWRVLADAWRILGVSFETVGGALAMVGGFVRCLADS